MNTEQVPGGRRRVVIYCRISDDREGRKYGVRRQERDCRSLAAALGFEVVAVLVENDRSAYSGKPRPEYNKLLDMLRDGEADGVLALTTRRLQRRFREAFDFLDLVEEKGLLVATVKGGRYDLSTADGRKEARRKAIDDQGEVEEIAERVRDAKMDNVREGTYRGGPRPFGYEADGTTPRSLVCPECGSVEGFSISRICTKCGAADCFNPERMCEECTAVEGFAAKGVCDDCGSDAVIAEGSEAWHADVATDAVIAAQSLRSIGADLTVKGIRTAPRSKRLPDGGRTEPQARDWTTSTLRNMILRPRNAGLLEVSGEIVGKAAWPAIVPEEKWRAAKAILENPNRRTTPGPAPKWLGTGLYLCGWPECTSTIRSAGRSGRNMQTQYQCKLGTHIKRTAAYVDDYVERVAVERLSRPDALALFLPPPPPEAEPAEKLAARANMLRAKLDQYVADHDEDLITRKQMLDGTARTRTRLEAVESEMASRTRGSALKAVPLGDPAAVAAAWAGYSLGRKQAIIGEIMTVTILPAPGGRPPGHTPGEPYFRPEFVRIEPKRPAESH